MSCHHSKKLLSDYLLLYYRERICINNCISSPFYLMISQLLSLIIIFPFLLIVSFRWHPRHYCRAWHSCPFFLVVSFRGLTCQYLKTVCIEWKTLPHSKWALCSCCFKLLSVKMWCILVQRAAQVVSKDAVISIKSHAKIFIKVYPIENKEVTLLMQLNW